MASDKKSAKKTPEKKNTKNKIIKSKDTNQKNKQEKAQKLKPKKKIPEALKPKRIKKVQKEAKTIQKRGVYTENAQDFKAKVDRKVQEKRESPDAYLKKMRKDQGYMPVGDHLEELRWRLIRIVIYVVAFAIGSFFFYDFIWEFLMGPIASLIEEAKKKDVVFKIIVTKLPENFLIQIKSVIFAGFLFAIPFVFFEIWRFIVPALEKASKIGGYILLLFSAVLFWAGMFTARFLVWPIVSYYLIFEWSLPEMAIENTLVKPEIHLTVADYLSFFFSFHMAFGLAFQMPIISIMLSLMGILHVDLFLKSWRGAIVVSALISAMVTPPDAVSMVAMMIPLITLFFISAILVWIVGKKKRKDDIV
ncbi:MAG: twin-arginine translocase subunit TatC [Spirochaetia bacterium]|nr:twin-arginine translocase subunit TatC [Spirochaetia bacterium]